MLTLPANKPRPARRGPRLAPLWGTVRLSLILSLILLLILVPIIAAGEVAGMPTAATDRQMVAYDAPSPAARPAPSDHDACDTEGGGCCHAGLCLDHVACSDHCMSDVPAYAILHLPLPMAEHSGSAPARSLAMASPRTACGIRRPPRRC